MCNNLYLDKKPENQSPFHEKGNWRLPKNLEFKYNIAFGVKLKIKPVFIYHKTSNENWFVFFIWLLLSSFFGWITALNFEAPIVMKSILYGYGKKMTGFEHNAFCFSIVFIFIFMPLAIIWIHKKALVVSYLRFGSSIFFWKCFIIIAGLGCFYLFIFHVQGDAPITGRHYWPVAIARILNSALGWKGAILYFHSITYICMLCIYFSIISRVAPINAIKEAEIY